MAVSTKGTAHLFGIAAGVAPVTNATVTNFSFTSTHANVSETVNEIGNKIEDRRDDLRGTGTITLKIRTSYTIPAAGTVLTYDSIVYLITSVEKSEEAQGFRTVTLNIETYEYISLS